MRIIAGKMRSRRIEAPEGKETRPTLDRVRENLFNILQTRIESAAVLDLFAGRTELYYVMQTGMQTGLNTGMQNFSGAQNKLRSTAVTGDLLFVN